MIFDTKFSILAKTMIFDTKFSILAKTMIFDKNCKKIIQKKMIVKIYKIKL